MTDRFSNTNLEGEELRTDRDLVELDPVDPDVL